MLMSLAGALTIAVVVVLAARATRERRALAAEVRALRAELRHVAAAVGAERSGGPARAAAVHRSDHRAEAASSRRPPRVVHLQRGSRTVH